MRTTPISHAVVVGLLACGSIVGGANAEMARQLGEYFELPRLHYVHFESGPLGTFAYLRPDCGHQFRVKVGSYVGTQDGKVVRISDKAIDVVELVPDGQGGWLERPRRLTLEPPDRSHPAPLRYLAYAQSASGVGAWIMEEGCPKVRVQVQDHVGDEGERVDDISRTQIRLIQCVFEKGSCRWVTRTVAIEKLP